MNGHRTCGEPVRRGLPAGLLAAVLAAVLLAVAPRAGLALDLGDYRGSGLDGAEDGKEDTFMGMEPLSEAEMAGLRGGMRIGGMKFDFAVEVRMETDVRDETGELFTLATTLKADAGEMVRTTEARVPEGRALTDAILASVEDVDTGRGGTLRAGDGRTSVTQMVSPGRLATTVQNVGNARLVSNRVEMDLVISNFTEQVGKFRMDRLGKAVGRRVTDIGLSR